MRSVNEISHQSQSERAVLDTVGKSGCEYLSGRLNVHPLNLCPAFSMNPLYLSKCCSCWIMQTRNRSGMYGTLLTNTTCLRKGHCDFRITKFIVSWRNGKEQAAKITDAFIFLLVCFPVTREFKWAISCRKEHRHGRERDPAGRRGSHEETKRTVRQTNRKQSNQLFLTVGVILVQWFSQGSSLSLYYNHTVNNSLELFVCLLWDNWATPPPGCIYLVCRTYGSPQRIENRGLTSQYS